MSVTGMPSVIAITSATFDASASRIASAANGGGTKISAQFARVSRTALATVQRGVGDDAAAVEREQREDLLVVELAPPAFDDLAIFDVVPREAPGLLGDPEEELVERRDVLAGERT